MKLYKFLITATIIFTGLITTTPSQAKIWISIGYTHPYSHGLYSYRYRRPYRPTPNPQPSRARIIKDTKKALALAEIKKYIYFTTPKHPAQTQNPQHTPPLQEENIEIEIQTPKEISTAQSVIAQNNTP